MHWQAPLMQRAKNTKHICGLFSYFHLLLLFTVLLKINYHLQNHQESHDHIDGALDNPLYYLTGGEPQKLFKFNKVLEIWQDKKFVYSSFCQILLLL